MKKYELQLKLLSSTLVGSGVGFGAHIDTDVVFDLLGIPYIPAKRLKGCLLDAVMEVRDMFDRADIAKDVLQIEHAFGKPGSKRSAPIYFSNLFIEDYDQNKNWLDYFVMSEDFQYIVTSERILNTFTEIRQQTKIGSDGVAFEHSLRTIRVLQKDSTFRGDVHIEEDDEQLLTTLLLACLNFNHFGTMRNRGFGYVHCSLLDDEGQDLTVISQLEALCTA